MSDPLIETKALDGGRGELDGRWLGNGRVRFEYLGRTRSGLTLVWRLHGEQGVAEARLPMTDGPASLAVTFPDDFSGGPITLAASGDGPVSYMVEWLLFSGLDPDEGRRELGFTNISVTDPWQ
jgi:hypothetical protein